MNVVLFFIVCFLAIRAFRSVLNKSAERDRERKKNKAYPPARYPLQRSGIIPKDDEYYYWARRERKEAWRRKFWKEKEKEWKRKGRTGLSTPYTRK